MKTTSVKTYIITDKVTVEIDIQTEKDFTPKKDGYSWGYIAIEQLKTSDSGSCFWDNIDFFVKSTLKEITEDCEKELIEQGLFEEGLLKKIKKEIKRIKKLGYL